MKWLVHILAKLIYESHQNNLLFEGDESYPSFMKEKETLIEKKLVVYHYFLIQTPIDGNILEDAAFAWSACNFAPQAKFYVLRSLKRQKTQ